MSWAGASLGLFAGGWLGLVAAPTLPAPSHVEETPRTYGGKVDRYESRNPLERVTTSRSRIIRQAIEEALAELRPEKKAEPKSGVADQDVDLLPMFFVPAPIPAPVLHFAEKYIPLSEIVDPEDEDDVAFVLSQFV